MSADGPGNSVFLLISKAAERAASIVRGPDNITQGSDTSHTFYGWKALALELRPTIHACVESRTIYANILDATQEVAILRAVTWDRIGIRRAILTQGVDYELVLPARFVTIPMQHVTGWLALFQAIAVPLAYSDEKSAKTPLRRLRIEWDYLYDVAERSWRSQGASFSLLNAHWDAVWRETTELLADAPESVGVREGFSDTVSEIIYDNKKYKSLASPVAIGGDGATLN